MLTMETKNGLFSWSSWQESTFWTQASNADHQCSSSFICHILLAFACASFFVIGYLFWKRWYTRQRLIRSGLPTVFWRPRFVNYRPDQEDDQKLASSTITNILPRMERLKGPFGMYGTVYGLSTAVVHVADPTPATAILSASSSARSCGSSRVTENKNGRHDGGRHRRSSRFDSSGVTKAPAYNHFKNFCGEGVFTADGDDWKAKRSTVMHALLRCPEGFETKVEREAHLSANRLLRDMEQRLKNDESQLLLNIVPLLQRATIGLIYRYITHKDLDTFATGKLHSDETEESSVSSTESAPSSPSTATRDADQPSIGLLSRYLESIIHIRMIILAQSRSFWFLLPRWLYRTFSSLYQEEERTLGPIREFADKACQNALPGSPLGILQKNPIYDSAEKNFSKNLIDEAITLLFAGQDTSAATLSWTLHLLSLYPKVQTKVAEEVRSVLSESKEEEPFVTKKLFSQMPYMDAVIKESMRLYPVAPFVVRKLPRPLSVEDESTSTTLPADSFACIWIYGLHRNPKYWDRANDFVPERWLDPKLKDNGSTCGAYMPFAVGPRNCVGQPLANIILRSLLARLLECYEFRDERLTEEMDPKPFLKDMQAGFTVLPKGGLNLSIRERAP